MSLILLWKPFRRDICETGKGRLWASLMLGLWHHLLVIVWVLVIPIVCWSAQRPRRVGFDTPQHDIGATGSLRNGRKPLMLLAVLRDGGVVKNHKLSL